MRYFVYSLEGGFTPHNPYFETEEYEIAVNVCDAFANKNKITAYVVDRQPKTMYGEVYVSVGHHFKQQYTDMVERISKLKEQT